MKRSLPNFRRGALGAAVLLALHPAAMAVEHTWSGGTFVSNVTAPNPLPAADTLNIVSGGFKYFDGAGFVFTNDGSVVWSTSNFIYMQNGAGAVNNGLWNSTTDSSLAYNGGAGTSFVNNGIFRKSGGNGSTAIGANTGFVNNGTLDAQAGSITFAGGATFNAGSVFSGAGNNVISGGAHSFNGSFTSSNLVLSGATFNGNAAVANGSVALTGGVLAGAWTVAAGAALNVSSGAFKYIEGSVVNAGSVNWNTSNFWYLQNGGSFTNNNLFNAMQSTSLVHNGGAATSFINSATGTLRAQAGQTLSLGGGAFGLVNNGGVFEALAGATIAVGGNAQLNGGNYIGAGSITINGNNNFSGTLGSSNLVFVNGTHSGSAAAMAGTAGWTGGAFSGGWTLNAAATLTTEAGAFKYLDAATFANDGTMVWNTTNFLYMQNGASLTNQGLFVANANTTISNNGGVQPLLDNTASGVIRASAGNTLNIGNMLVNNGGQLDAEAGAAIVYGGGASFSNNTRFTGAGVNRVTGNAAFRDSIQTANLELQNGNYSGTDAVLAGSLGWTGGRFSGGWTMNTGSTLSVATGAFKYLSNGTFTNNGAIEWNTSNLLYLENGGNLVNNGSFVANVSTTLANNGGAQPTLNNAATGVLRAAGGSALTVSNVLRNNGGQLDATAGSSIRYTGGAEFHDGTRFTGAGSNNVLGSSNFAGAISSANLVLEGGTQTGTAAVLSGNATWTGGRFQGGWQLAAGQSLAAGTGAFKYISGVDTVFDNQGTLVWNTSNLLYMENTARLQNAGTIDIRSEATSIVNNGGTPTFINTGLIVRSAGAGAANIGNGLAFDNLGTIDVQTGTLALPGNFVNHGVLKGVATYSVAGTLDNAAGGTVAPGASPGTLALTGNFMQSAGSFAVDVLSPGSHDLFNVSGTAALGGTLAISCFGACSYAVGDVITILDSVGNLSGTFANVTRSGFATGNFDVIYDTAADRVQLLVTEAVTPVPEPASYAMLIAGLGVLGWAARRRGRSGY